MRFPLLPCVLASLSGLIAAPAQAGPDPYIGDIVMVGQNFCPRGWREANGDLLPISSNTALFSLIGTIYGGDGRTTFALPDLRGRVPVGMGKGPGQPAFVQGEKFGTGTTTLTQAQLPIHNHAATSTAASEMHATSSTVNAVSPQGNKLGEFSAGDIYNSGGTLDQTMENGVVTTQVTTTVSNSGGSQSVEIYQPSLSMKFCIATVGVFPSRN